MADYRLIYTNLKTGALGGELPVISVSYNEGLNLPGGLSATILMEDTRTMEAPDGLGGSEEVTTPQGVTLTSIPPGATGIYLERDGVILWGGVLWTLDMDVAASTINIGAEGFMSYIRRLYVAEDLTYEAVAQGTIAQSLLAYAMAKPGAGIGLLSSIPPSSTTRTRYYPELERKNIGEALEQLAAVDGGFDIRWTHVWNGTEDGITSTMVISSDTLGRLTSYVFELGVNISLLSYSEDGSSMVNSAVVIGSAIGDSQMVGISFDSAAILTYPLLENVSTRADVITVDTLTAEAVRATTRGRQPIRSVSIEVFPDSVPGLGSYVMGDRIRVRGSYGSLELDDIYRIVDMSLQVDTNGQEIVSLALVPQETFG